MKNLVHSFPHFNGGKKWCIFVVERVQHWFRGRGVFFYFILSKIVEWSFQRGGVVQTKKTFPGRGLHIDWKKTHCYSLQMRWNNHPKVGHKILSACSYTVFHHLLKMLGERKAQWRYSSPVKEGTLFFFYIYNRPFYSSMIIEFDQAIKTKARPELTLLWSKHWLFKSNLLY